MIISLKNLGNLEGKPVKEATLTSSTGVSLSILSFGALIRDWQVPLAQGGHRSVVLGFKNWESYLSDTIHLGAIVGRVANRIGGAQFKLRHKTYKLPININADHLHGGPEGLSRQNWQMNVGKDHESIELRLHSPDGQMGYPGAVDFLVIYRLTGSRLRIEMSATVTAETPINMVQHNYFNLSGTPDILQHWVQIQAKEYTPLSPALITTGAIEGVYGTRYDFTEAKQMQTDAGTADAYDINFVLDKKRDFPVDEAAQLWAPDRSLQLKLWTDQVGLQLYNGEYIDIAADTLSGQPYGAHAGLCLEDQAFPDAVNKPQFPPIWVTPETPYAHWCEIEIK